jgi:hypothetical protein
MDSFQILKKCMKVKALDVIQVFTCLQEAWCRWVDC